MSDKVYIDCLVSEIRMRDKRIAFLERNNERLRKTLESISDVPESTINEFPGAVARHMQANAIVALKSKEGGE